MTHANDPLTPAGRVRLVRLTKIVARYGGHGPPGREEGRADPDGGGWRTHGRGSGAAKAVERAKATGARAGYVYLHSAIDGFSRLAYTKALANETAVTMIGFWTRARVFFTAHATTHITRVVTDSGSNYRAKDFHRAIVGTAARHQRIRPTRPSTTGRSNAATGPSPKNSSTPPNEPQKPNGPPPSGSGTSTRTTIDPILQSKQPPASRLPAGVTNVMTQNTRAADITLQRSPVDGVKDDRNRLPLNALELHCDPRWIECR